MATLPIFVLLFLYSLVCNGAIPTSLPAALTGNCTSSSSTWAVFSSPTTVLASATPLVDGHFTTSFYSTASLDYTYYTFFTLGCQSASTSCCPPEAISTATDTDADTIIFSIKAVTACPVDYVTTVDQGLNVYAAHYVTDLQPTTLCCPSGWEIFPTALPQPGDTDTNPCYQPLPNPGADEDGSNNMVPGMTVDYPVTYSSPYVGGGVYYTLGVRMTRSYRLVKPGRENREKLGTGTVVGIAVPIGCLFIGGGIVYWIYRTRQKKRAEKTKREESEKGPGMPELGHGLPHELEPLTKLGAAKTAGTGIAEEENKTEGEKEPGKLELGERRRHELEPGRRTEPRATEADGNGIHELHSATLVSPWSDGPLHELLARDIREMDSNVPAAHEVDVENW